MKLSSLHQNLIARLAQDAYWSHKRIEGYVRKETGYNARSLQLLRRAGLVESKVFTGPRGGRIVGIRLTSSGLWVAQRIADIAEGTAPMDEQGNFVRDVVTGEGTFTVEGR